MLLLILERDISFYLLRDVRFYYVVIILANHGKIKENKI